MTPPDSGRPITREALQRKVAQLAPGYLANRRKDLADMTAALEAGDFEAVRKPAHKIKGSGLGYGFPRLSDIGGALETAAEAADAGAVRAGLEDLTQFLDTTQVP